MQDLLAFSGITPLLSAQAVRTAAAHILRALEAPSWQLPTVAGP